MSVYQYGNKTEVHEFITYIRRNLLHVSATFCRHLEVCVVPRICYKDYKQCINIKY
jgi:hypothetical protein